ncbi:MULTISPECIES: endonuclease/exonuclease/phosphatase family protein [unclassified Yoonia]|uniref:endonuclease/exonuclease/phosphatase family protein n=1 Tax=unclassified Yoonia TaxID=2629118 RepID=UPI002AFE38A9|nr:MULTISPECIES: endonuclease/exonuclease/phosphatase family protein [unclassified Yoonia]
MMMKDAPQDHRSIRLASYNIRKAKGVDGRYDPGRIVDILAGLEADVVAVQEVDFRWRGRPGALSAQMIAANTDYDIVPVGGGDSLGFHGNALLVRRGTLVQQVKRLILPGLEPRGALLVDLGLAGGISIVATHLGLTRFHRQRQLAAILAAMDPDTRASVIMGDFNEWSATRGLDPLQRDFTIHAPGKSFHAALPMAALDRIALNRDVTLIDGGVVQNAQSLKASDHLPVWGEVVVRRRNPG